MYTNIILTNEFDLFSISSIQEPKFTKKILKHGDKTTFPSKGDRVSCFYTGKLENGVVFDSNVSGAGMEDLLLSEYTITLLM